MADSDSEDMDMNDQGIEIGQDSPGYRPTPAFATTPQQPLHATPQQPDITTTASSNSMIECNKSHKIIDANSPFILSHNLF